MLGRARLEDVDGRFRSKGSFHNTEAGMKALRILGGLLLLFTGIVHIGYVAITPSDPNALPMVVFGIVYVATGVLLLLKIRYSAVGGLVFPAIGLGSGFFLLGLQNWTPLLVFLYSIDAVIMLCCIAMLIRSPREILDAKPSMSRRRSK
jgi:hypothetical protein